MYSFKCLILLSFLFLSCKHSEHSKSKFEPTVCKISIERQEAVISHAEKIYQQFILDRYEKTYIDYAQSAWKAAVIFECEMAKIRKEN